MRYFMIALLALLIPAPAHGAPYAEYAPDYSLPMTIQPGATVAEVFEPLNDRLSAVEIWVSTGGVSAGLHATLVNPSGTAIAVIDVPLGAIPDSASGSRIRITLPAQLAVSGEQTYRLNLSPTGAGVTFYYSTSVAIAPGSGGSASSYSYGAAVVNGVEQGYSFKFALLETSEVTKPDISGVQITQPAIGQAIISFHSTEPVDTQTVYGPNTLPWTGEFTPCLPGMTACSVSLTTAPGTTYAYTLSVKDIWGNVSTVEDTFTAVGVGPTGNTAITPTTTPSFSPPPTTPPPLDDGRSPTIMNPRLVSLSATAATFAWTTDETASSWVVILVLPELTAWSYVLDNTAELEHYVPITGLPPDQYLRGRITSTDEAGNFSTINIDFKTPAFGASPTPVQSPVFSIVPTPSGSPTPLVSPSGTPIPSLTGTPPVLSQTPSPSAVAYPSTSSGPGIITWPPSGGGGGYRIDIFDENGNLITTILADANATSAPLPEGLPKGARIIIYADRDGAFEKIGDPITITDRPFVPASSPFLTPVLTLIGGGAVLVALVVAWVLQRRRQHIKVDAMTSIGGGMGSSSRLS